MHGVWEGAPDLRPCVSIDTIRQEDALSDKGMELQWMSKQIMVLCLLLRPWFKMIKLLIIMALQINNPMTSMSGTLLI
jgi:hypothetical protein